MHILKINITNHVYFSITTPQALYKYYVKINLGNGRCAGTGDAIIKGKVSLQASKYLEKASELRHNTHGKCA